MTGGTPVVPTPVGARRRSPVPAHTRPSHLPHLFVGPRCLCYRLVRDQHAKAQRPGVGGRDVNVAQAKQTAAAWVESNLAAWPGLQAAHLVGGITSLADHAPWPTHKDLDMHLVFAEGSPALEPKGPFPEMIEVPYEGLSIEGGLKSIVEYRSVEAVLANPEIAHHIMVGCSLYDPHGILAGLERGVRPEYARRRWVQARLAYEREGLAGALAMRPVDPAMPDLSRGAMVLGYTSTFIAAACSVATLLAPTTGSRGILRTRDVLCGHRHADLYEALLELYGTATVRAAEVEAFLCEGMAAFDLTVAVRRSPHPFQHKLHAHLKPYFVESCRNLIAEGFSREAMLWLTPFYHSSIDVILTDGPECEREGARARHERFLAAIGLDSDTAMSAAFDRAVPLFDECFAVADEIVACHPKIVD